MGCVREEGISGSAEANTNPSLGYLSAIIVDGVVMQSEAEDLLRSRPLFLGRARSLQEAFVEDVAGEPREALQFCKDVVFLLQRLRLGTRKSGRVLNGTVGVRCYGRH